MGRFYIYGLFAFFIGLAIGVISMIILQSYFFENIYSDEEIESIKQNFFDRGLEEAENRLENYFVDGELDKGERTELRGRIVEMDTNLVGIQINPTHPLMDPELVNRTVIVDEGVDIYRRVERDYEEYREELDEYTEEYERVYYEMDGEGAENLERPEEFEYIEISLDELEVGRWINIKSDEDIADVDEINPDEIVIRG